jgi:hypothetical protein
MLLLSTYYLKKYLVCYQIQDQLSWFAAFDYLATLPAIGGRGWICTNEGFTRRFYNPLYAELILLKMLRNDISQDGW